MANITKESLIAEYTLQIEQVKKLERNTKHISELLNIYVLCYTEHVMFLNTDSRYMNCKVQNATKYKSFKQAQLIANQIVNGEGKHPEIVSLFQAYADEVDKLESLILALQ